MAGFDKLSTKLLVLAYNAADTSAAGTVTLGNRVDDNKVVCQLFHSAEAAICAVINKFTINLVCNQRQVIFQN
ncbi:hypothetical protein EVA_14957 [gut metagenome]|uniref:Uncharacterized protein n=1 Tax=gut metagenome TaxID=749906 RepID=J9FPQ5_9ZZZZ